MRRPNNPIGIGWAAPTILAAGTQAQKERYLMGALSGEEFWCQLFSEPDAGSDLASLSTRAERRGDGWVLNGAKIWTSGAHLARYGILIARTDPSAPKHRGISFFVCPMDTPGITLAPIVDMTGAHSFNQVFFDDVQLDSDTLIGEEGDGWRLAKATLANERVSLSSGGALWGMGPSVGDLIDLVRRDGGVSDPLMRQDLARVWSEGEILRLIRLRSLTARLQGPDPWPGGIGAEAAGRRARPARDGGGPAAGRPRGHGHRGRARRPPRRDGRKRAYCSGVAERQDRTWVGERRPDLVLRVPVLAGADHRRGDLGGAAQHRGRTVLGLPHEPSVT